MRAVRRPAAALPDDRARPRAARQRTDPGAFLGLDLPIAGIAGDQQAALFGQTCFDVASPSAPTGPGSFILTNTGTEIVRSRGRAAVHGGLEGASGERTYALEGSIFVTGAAVQWLRDGLGLIGTAASRRRWRAPCATAAAWCSCPR